MTIAVYGHLWEIKISRNEGRAVAYEMFDYGMCPLKYLRNEDRGRLRDGRLREVVPCMENFGISLVAKGNWLLT